MFAPHRTAAPALSQETVAALYCNFVRAAELQDQHAPEAAAAWHTLGRVTCALAASSAVPKLGDVSSALTQRLDRIIRELGLLHDAARMGGTLSAATVLWFATVLLTDFARLREELDRLFSVSPERAEI